MSRILPCVGIAVAVTLSACLAVPALALLIIASPVLLAAALVLRLACDTGVAR